MYIPKRGDASNCPGNFNSRGFSLHSCDARTRSQAATGTGANRLKRLHETINGSDPASVRTLPSRDAGSRPAGISFFTLFTLAAPPSNMRQCRGSTVWWILPSTVSSFHAAMPPIHVASQRFTLQRLAMNQGREGDLAHHSRHGPFR